jgi:hypothetical protein
MSYKVGDRIVVLTDFGFLPDFKFKRATVVPFEELEIAYPDIRPDNIIGFKLDEPVKGWNSLYFSQQQTILDITRFVPEEVFNSPLYKAITE